MGSKKRYTREDKLAAVSMVTERGRSILSVANEYGVHENTIWKWKQEYAINPLGAFTDKEQKQAR